MDNTSLSNDQEHVLKIYWPPFFPSVNTNCARYPTLHANKYCPNPGLMIEILGIIAKDAGLKLISVTSDDFKEQYDKMNIKDIWDMMLNGTLDSVGVALQKTEKREQTMEFSEYLYMTNTRFLRSSLKDNNGKLGKMLSFFQTYDTSTWYALLFTLILQWIFCVLARRFEAYTTKTKPMSLADCGWQILRLQLLQPETLRFRSTSGNFAMCIFSLFQCSILLRVFSSFILASIITEKSQLKGPMTEMIRLLSTGQYYMITNDPFKWFFEKINTSDCSPYPELRAALANNRLRTTYSQADALQKVTTDNAILFQQVDESSFFEAMSYCGITVLEQNMPEVKAHLALRKNHPFMRRINETIKRNRHRFIGLAKRYYQQALKNNQCSNGHGYKALTIHPFLGLIFTCFFIIFIAFLIFASEIMFGKSKKSLKQLERLNEKRKESDTSF